MWHFEYNRRVVSVLTKFATNKKICNQNPLVRVKCGDRTVSSIVNVVRTLTTFTVRKEQGGESASENEKES